MARSIRIEYMEPPRMDSPHTRDHFYYVPVPGGGQRFTSEKAALRYLAQLNREINGHWFALSDTMHRLHGTLRMLACTLSPTDLRRLKMEIRTAEDILDRMPERKGINAAAFTFQDMHNVCVGLAYVADRLRECPTMRAIRAVRTATDADADTIARIMQFIPKRT